MKTSDPGYIVEIFVAYGARGISRAAAAHGPQVVDQVVTALMHPQAIQRITAFSRPETIAIVALRERHDPVRGVARMTKMARFFKSRGHPGVKDAVQPTVDRADQDRPICAERANLSTNASGPAP